MKRKVLSSLLSECSLCGYLSAWAHYESKGKRRQKAKPKTRDCNISRAKTFIGNRFQLKTASKKTILLQRCPSALEQPEFVTGI